MSDKEKNPDFQIEIDEDELVLDLENDIFDEAMKESDDLLTEEELENLIIGIDEENDILDIPDEEEVLEELKFFDENFSLPEEEPVEVKKEEKKPEKKEKPKKEKPVKIPKPPKAPREPFDLQYFLIKNKFKLIGGFLIFIIVVFLLTFFLVLNKKPKVEEFETIITSQSAIIIEKPAEVEEDILSEEEKAIKSLKEELVLVSDENRKKALQDEIIKLEEQKIAKAKDEKIQNLKKYYEDNLKTLSSSIVKSEEEILIVAFVIENSNFQEDLYKAIAKTFEDNFQINKLNFNILEKGDGLKKIGEITVDIKKFNEISKQNISTEEKLKLLNYQKREK